MTRDRSPRDPHDAFYGLVDAAFDAFRSNVRHAARVVSDVTDDEADVDVFQEVSRFWTLAAKGLGRSFGAGRDLLESLDAGATDTGDNPASAVPTGGPQAAVTCSHIQDVGPFDTDVQITALPLRRRGEEIPAIAANRITLSPQRVTKQKLAPITIKVQCGGVPRGLYEGKLQTPTGQILYNIYIDPEYGSFA